MSGMLSSHVRNIGGRLLTLSNKQKFVNICSVPFRQNKTQAEEKIVENTRNNVNNDQPVAYTKSKAFQYKAIENFQAPENSSHTWYTPYVIRISVIMFLLYFCVLREPNEIDEKLDRSLFETMPELEIPMLEVEVRRLEANGIDTKELRAKIEQLKTLSKTN